MSNKKLFLMSSDIAAFIGQNSYDFVTPFERLWKRCDSEGYNKILDGGKNKIVNTSLEISSLILEQNVLKDDLETKKITKRQYTLRNNKIQIKIDDLKKNINLLESSIDKISLNDEQRLEKKIGQESILLVKSENIETNDKQKIISDVIEKLDISKQEKITLLKESTSFINKTHGTLKEDSAISIYEKRVGVKLNTSQEFFKKQIFAKHNFDWYIGGRLDGLYIDKENHNKSYIVEVKNRTRGFFTSLRDYEKTQMQIYMHILSIPITKLVEKYEDKIRITVVHKDDEYISDILEYLDIFAESFVSIFLKDENLKHKFFYSDNFQKANILQNLYLNKINKTKDNKLTSLEKQTDVQMDPNLDSDL